MQLIKELKLSPEENIALDEVMLAKAEGTLAGETLRFWESDEYFVVLGRAESALKNCFLEKCTEDNIKIIRRTSGGGTVLQGAGCLNWSGILSYEKNKLFKDIRSSYKAILSGLKNKFSQKGYPLEFFPVCDLAFRGRKVSGNAQARKKKFFLHHGTFLYNFDIEKVGMYLKHPPAEPEYRLRRPHDEFVVNLPISPEKIKDIIKEVFPPTEGIFILKEEDKKTLKGLVHEKYSKRTWNLSI